MSPHQVNNDQQQEQKQGSSAGGSGISSKAPTGHGGLGGIGKSPKHWLMGDKAFEARMPHHDGVQALWETKWKFPVSFFCAIGFWLSSFFLPCFTTQVFFLASREQKGIIIAREKGLGRQKQYHHHLESIQSGFHPSP